MWDFDFEQDDSFITSDFVSTDGIDSDFANDFMSDSTMVPPQQITPSNYMQYQPMKKTTRQTTDNSSAIVYENDVLRETALKLKERFSRASTENQTLRAQLEECRSKFRNAMFSGILGAKK